MVNDKVETLIEQVKAPQWHIRKKAIEALMKLGTEAGDAAPLLINALADRSWKVREAAARSLGRIGSRISHDDERGNEIIFHLLNSMLSEASWDVAITAINALAEIGPRSLSAVPALIASLQDEEEAVRVSCIEALRQINARALLEKSLFSYCIKN